MPLVLHWRAIQPLIELVGKRHDGAALLAHGTMNRETILGLVALHGAHSASEVVGDLLPASEDFSGVRSAIIGDRFCGWCRVPRFKSSSSGPWSGFHNGSPVLRRRPLSAALRGNGMIRLLRDRSLAPKLLYTSC